MLHDCCPSPGGRAARDEHADDDVVSQHLSGSHSDALNERTVAAQLAHRRDEPRAETPHEPLSAATRARPHHGWVLMERQARRAAMSGRRVTDADPRRGLSDRAPARPRVSESPPRVASR